MVFQATSAAGNAMTALTADQLRAQLRVLAWRTERLLVLASILAMDLPDYYTDRHWKDVVTAAQEALAEALAAVEDGSKVGYGE